MESNEDPRVILFFKMIELVDADIDVMTPPFSEKSGVTGVAGHFLMESWKCNELDTMKIIFYIRDCRGGKGSRDLFYLAITSLAVEHSEELEKYIKHIPFYGRYKDLLYLLGTQNEKAMLKIYAEQLIQDKKALLENRPISLAAKYAPSEGSATDVKYDAVNTLCKFMRISRAKYRKQYLFPLRKKLDILERHMTNNNNDWGSIDFTGLSMCILKKYHKAFMKHLGQKYIKWSQNIEITPKKCDVLYDPNSGESRYQYMRRILDSPRYDRIN